MHRAFLFATIFCFHALSAVVIDDTIADQTSDDSVLQQVLRQHLKSKLDQVHSAGHYTTEEFNQKAEEIRTQSIDDLGPIRMEIVRLYQALPHQEHAQ